MKVKYLGQRIKEDHNNYYFSIDEKELKKELEDLKEIIEVIPCSEVAKKNIESVPAWKN